jgi:hypothetical protein
MTASRVRHLFKVFLFFFFVLSSVYYDDTIAIPLLFLFCSVLSCFLDLPHTPLCVLLMSGGYVPFSLYVDFHAFMSNGMVWAVRSGAVICFVFFFFFPRFYCLLFLLLLASSYIHK